MSLRLQTRKAAFCGLALLLVVSSCAKPATFETIDTSLAWPYVEPGRGSQCRAQLQAAVGDIEGKRFEEADRKLSTVLSCFRALMTDHEFSVYISVANADELDRYRSDHRGDREVVWIDWGYREALQLKAFMLSAQREFDKALDLLRFQAKIAPYSAAPYTERGYILNVGLRKPQEALEAYRHALALAREFESSSAEEPVALRGIGFALIELGDLDPAESMFQASLESDPGNELALNELSYIEQLRRTQR